VAKRQHGIIEAATGVCGIDIGSGGEKENK